LFKVFYSTCVHRVACLDDLIYAIEDKIASLLVEDLLLTQI
jgi:hypothetical protein